MVNYADGKIYRLLCNTTGLTYYGSTTQPLYKRLHGHKNNKDCSSKIIIEAGNYDIVLVEAFACKTKEELHARERYFIESNECVNKAIPTRTYKEWHEANKEQRKEYHKAYLEANKEQRKEYHKAYHEANKEQRKEYHKAYHEANKEHIKAYKKAYHEANKEHNKEYLEANKEHIKANKKEYYAKKKL
jgi:hypothetical protein